mgnify:FL=1
MRGRSKVSSINSLLYAFCCTFAEDGLKAHIIYIIEMCAWVMDAPFLVLFTLENLNGYVYTSKFDS